jgi:hypothetical protein
VHVVLAEALYHLLRDGVTRLLAAHGIDAELMA